MVNHVFHADGEYLYYWYWGPGGGANWMIGPEIGGTNRYRTPCHFRYIFSYSEINFEFEKSEIKQKVAGVGPFLKIKQSIS